MKELLHLQCLMMRQGVKQRRVTGVWKHRMGDVAGKGEAKAGAAVRVNLT